MYFSRVLFVSFTCATLLARAQTPPVLPAGSSDQAVHLDSFIVSAGPDAKTSFDLAQGTSVLAGAELRQRAAATLGETLASTPGVSATAYGPGASRPLIRGLGGERVRLLSSGVGALDASGISPDHNLAIEPLFASRIEVLRGPATLLYGSSAVGGVVNVIDNRIPETPGDGRLRGALETRLGGAGDERTGVAALTLADSSVSFQANALLRRTGDVDIPGIARIDAGAPAAPTHGTLPNSAIDTRSGSFGVTGFWAAGHVGAALSRYETTYGVPTGDDPPIAIDLKQTRLDLAAEITQPFGFFRSARARASYGRYRHSEIEGTEVGTTFKNDAWEGRLELPHLPLGNITGTVGLQGAFSDFNAIGEEVSTPPSKTGTGALFVLEEMKTPGATFQFGARYERLAIKLGEVSPTLPLVPGFSARSGETLTRSGVSGSFGVVIYPAVDYSLGLSVAYTERLPTAQELFSNGPHGGTGSYEVGTSRLERERSLGLEASLRKRAGFFTGSAGVFVNRFRDYVFEQELPAGTVPLENNPDGLTEYQFTAADALFYGAEVEAIAHLIERDHQRLHLRLFGDYVHAEETNRNEPLPRIPPLRLGAGLDHQTGPWTAGVAARRSLRQNRFAATETSTAAYTLVEAHLSYRLSVMGKGGAEAELFLRGENLTDATARAATSFLKDVAPLAGRGITLGARVAF